MLRELTIIMIVWLVVFYAIFSFIAWEIDPSQWQSITRFLLMCVDLFGFGACVKVYYDK